MLETIYVGKFEMLVTDVKHKNSDFVTNILKFRATQSCHHYHCIPQVAVGNQLTGTLSLQTK